MRLASVFLVLLCVTACKERDPKPKWELFNSELRFAVRVTAASEPLGEDIVEDIESNTASVSLGTISVSPGSGPVGTTHEVQVVVSDEYEDAVGRAFLVTESEERGTEEHTFFRDSADLGYWVLNLKSLGSEGETRKDFFSLELYTDVNESEGS